MFLTFFKHQHALHIKTVFGLQVKTLHYLYKKITD